MKRRDFLVLLASLVSTRAASQSAASLPAVAFLGFATEESDRPAVEAFQKGLAEQGLVHGQTIELVTRHAGGDLNVAADLIRDLIRKPVAVFLVPGRRPRGPFGARLAISVVAIGLPPTPGDQDLFCQCR